MSDEPAKPTNRWRRRFFLLLAAWIISTVLLSIREVRGFVAMPLYVNHPQCSGEAAYVLADGHAYWERLHAASDLYNMKRIERIILLDEQSLTSYSFSRGRSETLVERAIQYLIMHGVPRDKVSTIRSHHSTNLGTLSEARGVAESESKLDQLIIVTSAPHTRRSYLAFQRAMPATVDIKVYAATPPADSMEVDAPIWTEYAKLMVYWFIA